MLEELRIQNLLLIDDAVLELGPGLNVLTGETGAGKTLLAAALGLLLGERSRSGLVRPGADEAWVEGIFGLPQDNHLSEELRELLPDGAEELVLARRIWPDGRSRALINGRTATVGDLRELGTLLISFHGQHEHRKLALAAFQLDAVDAAAGEAQLALRRQAGELHAEVRAAEAHLGALTGADGAAQREVDLLRYEVEEIDSVASDLERVDEIKAERERLRSVDALRAALEGLAALAGDETGAMGPADGLSVAARGFDQVSGIDREVDALGERAGSLSIEAVELSREARLMADSLDGSPQRLDQLEETLDIIERLSLKHGGSAAAVLEHATQARARLAELDDLDGAIERAGRALAEARESQQDVAKKLRAGRSEAARRLGPAVEAQLADLALEGAVFRIEVESLPEAGPLGSDRVTFMVSANTGLEPAPIGDAASGGEMSRILLALLAVSAEQGGDAEGNLIVFDEIDAGIGGRTAKAVGQRLAALASGRQVLCITHLPQVAASAGRHFRISKEVGSEATRTAVEPLEGDGLEEEMVRMLGGEAGDAAVLAHARELLADRAA